MTEHRRRKTAATSLPQTTTISTERRGEAWQSLPDIYGLDDMFEDAPAHNELTVEQEYSLYTMAHVSAQGTDLIKFWEVRMNSSCFCTTQTPFR